MQSSQAAFPAKWGKFPGKEVNHRKAKEAKEAILKQERGYEE
jgi:hypothetical protein